MRDDVPTDEDSSLTDLFPLGTTITTEANGEVVVTHPDWKPEEAT